MNNETLTKKLTDMNNAPLMKIPIWAIKITPIITKTAPGVSFMLFCLLKSLIITSDFITAKHILTDLSLYGVLGIWQGHPCSTDS